VAGSFNIESLFECNYLTYIIKNFVLVLRMILVKIFGVEFLAYPSVKLT